jgi:hypothetical protein
MEFINLPMILILIGGFIVVLGGFLASIRQNQDQAKFANERAEFERDSRVKSDKIAELNETIASSVTGGNSFCYVVLAPVNQANALVTLVQQGKYPLFDVGIRMVNLDEFGKSEGTGIVLDVGNMPPNSASPLSRIPFSNSEKIRYNIFISARNGFFTELLRMHKVNGVYKYAIKVTRDEFSDETPDAPPTILMEKIDQDFPTNKDSHVDW